MPARALKLIPFLVVQAFLGGISGHLLGGIVATAVTATLAVIASTVIAARGRESAYRQSILAAILIALHIAALYTIGDDGKTLLPGANTQLLAAGLGLVACVGFARRLRAAAAMSEPHDRRSVLVEDDDDRTIELDPPKPAALPRVEPPPLQTIPPPRLRSPLALGVVSTALFIVATLFWIGDDGRHDGLASNAEARELPTPSSSGDSVTSPTTVETATDAPEPAALAIPELPAADTGGTTASGTNALAPSAARRECMAQIESANLFLQIARQSADQTEYALATQGHITRMLKSRPVGPRTLGRIAERMWDLREAPERGSAWWASQFTRCEAARSGGSWYVVKG